MIFTKRLYANSKKGAILIGYKTIEWTHLIDAIKPCAIYNYTNHCEYFKIEILIFRTIPFAHIQMQQRYTYLLQLNSILSDRIFLKWIRSQPNIQWWARRFSSLRSSNTLTNVTIAFLRCLFFVCFCDGKKWH